MIGVLLHGRMRQNGAELRPGMIPGGDAMFHRLGCIGFVLNE